MGKSMNLKGKSSDHDRLLAMYVLTIVSAEGFLFLYFEVEQFLLLFDNIHKVPKL